MRRAPLLSTSLLSLTLGAFMPSHARAQEVGFLEKFALADDRSKVLQDLIPGSHDYFYYHILHYQNTGRIAEAQAFLEKWSAIEQAPPSYQKLLARQKILGYATNPSDVLEYLRLEMGLALGHAPPQADQARDLPTELDPALHDLKRWLDHALAHDPQLGSLSAEGLLALAGRDLPIDKLRIVLQRIERVDVALLTGMIEKELRSADSRGWGAFPIHAMLTLSQRQELARKLPQLLENDTFVRQYLFRLLPQEHVAINDTQEQRAHLQRLEDFASTLPESQNSLKGLILFQRLALDASEEKFDRPRFERYLSLPRHQPYCNIEFLKANRNIPHVDFNAQYAGETRFPPIADDTDLIRRYLEHFLQADDNIDRFTTWLDRGFLERVLVETKILYGIGNNSAWYSKLDASQQKQIRDRVELRFAPISKSYYKPNDPVQLVLDVKNVPKLIVRLYQLNPQNIYRKQGQPVSADIDLDGLVANSEQTLEYTLPADRRHREVIEIPECSGRGAWVIDVLGGGLRSRALVIKGQLRSTQSLTDAGHEFRIYDESGTPARTATIEMGTRTFRPDDEGRILIPYGERDQTIPILLVDGSAATVEILQHRRENYLLEMGLLIDEQNLVSGAKGSLIVRPQLLCNGQPTSIESLEDATLTIVTTDQDGTQSTLSVPDIGLRNDLDAAHQFLVPQRLRSVTVTLSGKVLFVSRNTKETLNSTQTIKVNDVPATSQIADYYLISDEVGYRLQVRGRNGEPIPKLPVTVQLTVDGITNNPSALLATDEKGEIRLGELLGVSTLSASSTAVSQRSFALRGTILQWPGKLSVVAGESLDFPWAMHRTDRLDLNKACTLLESRGGQVVADLQSKLSVSNGRLQVAALDPGLYYLTNHRLGKVVEIRSVKGELQHGFILGDSQSIEHTAPLPASIVTSEIQDGKLRVRLGAYGPSTRVHWVATTFMDDKALSSRMLVSEFGQFRQVYQPTRSFYIDSLKLDEEYQYILQRQYATKVPGNLLSQPSLLLNPWDTAATENARRDAAQGDMPPPAAAAPMASEYSDGLQRKLAEGEGGQGRSTFEFLAKPAILMSNRRPDADGWMEFPIDGFKGYHCITAVIIDENGIVSQTIPLPPTEFPTNDRRLEKSFPNDQHLSQVQRAQILEAGVTTDLGDARSTRIQVYSTIADIYRLYSTLQPSADLEKFRGLTRWNQLSEEEKSRTVSELACHELHLFLYMKDRPFFDRVIAPYLGNKYQKQVVDGYLLQGDIASYLEPWQRQRLNAMERILLLHRVPESAPGIRKWIQDAVEASPVSPDERTVRFLAAISGASLDLNRPETASVMLQKLSKQDFKELDKARYSLAELETLRQSRGEQPGKDAFFADRGGSAEESLSFGVPTNGAAAAGGLGGAADLPAPPGSGGPGARGKRESRRRMLGREMLYTSLDSTREWAESQYYRTRIQQQGLHIIPPGPFWKELAGANALENFLSTEFHLSTHTLSEALSVLAMVDLPFEANEVQLTVENGRLMATSEARSVVFLESIQPVQSGDDAASIVLGQDLYLVAPGTDSDPQKPVTGQPLVRGTGYRASVVVTNPSSVRRTVSVLTQIPQGSLPLDGGKFVTSKTLQLEPYTTQQIAYAFYYPTAGEFAHYAPQISIDGKFVTEGPSAVHRVLDTPEGQDKDSWNYVALWGTNQQVLDFLAKRNVQQLQLDWIAFRMKDKGFYESCLRELESQGIFHPTLWAYSVQHNDPERIAQLINFREDWVERLGPVFVTPITKIDTAQRYNYEHLDYRPLVHARTHLLGAQRVILNDRLAGQYATLLERLMHQPNLNSSERMAITYYFIVQNRIEEAIQQFDRIVADELTMRIQYDYLDAYLGFYRDRYDHAAQIAERYANYGVSRWRDLFAQIRLQVAQRTAMIEGRSIPTHDAHATDVTDPIQRMLLDVRGTEQTELASLSPTIDLTVKDGELLLGYQNLESVEVRFYQMDIELLFSRNPFVQQDGGSLMAIQPNRTETLRLESNRGKRVIELPKDFANRNVLVEVTSGALSQSEVVVANSMDVTLADSFGRVQITTKNGQPVEKAYVKVYARHRGGEVKFFKDGYTDLRGQFDYTSLSTNDLETTDRFSILILHPELGAVIREAAPPRR